MYEMSDRVAEAIENGTRRILSISWGNNKYTTNENIWSESLEITQTLTDSENIGFGKCNSSQMSVILGGIDRDCIGKKIRLSILFDEFNESLPLGTYTVESAERQDNRSFIKITAYDDMRLLQRDVSDWYNSLGLSADNGITHKDMLSSLLNYCKLSFYQEEINSMANAETLAYETIKPSKLTGLQVAEDILELSGCFGTIDRFGRFHIVTIAPTEGLYPAYTLFPSDNIFPMDVVGDKLVASSVSKSKYSKCNYEEYETKPINSLQIRTEEGDIGYIINAPDTADYENGYIVTGNFLTYGMKHEQLGVVAENMLQSLKAFYFTPLTVDVYNLPQFELGDIIAIETDRGRLVTPIMSHNLRGIQLFKQELASSGNEILDFSITETNVDIEQLRGYTNSLKRTVTETISELKNLEENTESQFIQTADRIATKVSKGEVSSEISQEADLITIQGNRIEIDSTNFTLTQDGKITAGDGQIGALLIGAQGLSDSYGDDWKIKIATGENNNWGFMSEMGEYYAGLINGKLGLSSTDGYTVSADSRGVYATQRDTTNMVGFNSNEVTISDGDSVTRLTPTKIESRYFTTNTSADVFPTGTSGIVAWQQLCVVGGMWAQAYNNLSDERMKHDIADLDDKYAEALLKVQPKVFRYNSDTQEHKLRVGFIAQDVDERLKECGADDIDTVKNGEYMSLDYVSMIPILLKIIQRQEERIKKLEEGI